MIIDIYLRKDMIQKNGHIQFKPIKKQLNKNSWSNQPANAAFELGQHTQTAIKCLIKMEEEMCIKLEDLESLLEKV